MKVKETFRRSFFLHFEWVMLTLLLISAALINPYSGGVSFCLLDMAGFSFCPGTGLGRSIALFYRGNITESFQMHPAGIAAVLIIMGRIGSILHRNYQLYQQKGG
jgi:hypothetical protein